MIKPITELHIKENTNLIKRLKKFQLYTKLRYSENEAIQTIIDTIEIKNKEL